MTKTNISLEIQLAKYWQSTIPKVDLTNWQNFKEFKTADEARKITLKLLKEGFIEKPNYEQIYIRVRQEYTFLLLNPEE